MKLCFSLMIIMCSILDCSAQKKFDPLSLVLEPQAAKRARYKLNVWKYMYEVHMKDGSVLKANSDILKDNNSGKYFIYYSKGDSLRKIFPEETTKIERPNPFDMPNKIEGYPNEKLWKFKVIQGKISANCFFINGNEINEIQLNDGEVVAFSPEYLRTLLTLNKALKAYDKKDYYTAIKIHNQKNSD